MHAARATAENFMVDDVVDQLMGLYEEKFLELMSAGNPRGDVACVEQIECELYTERRY